MNQSEVESVLIAIVCELQELSGREKVAVTADTCPLTDMPGFDSLNGVEATIYAGDRVKMQLDFNNVFADNDIALTIKQAASRVIACMKEKS